MKLFKYYSLDECINKKAIINKMKSLKNEGKIEYDIDGEILQIDDIDLEEIDIEELNRMFDENDVLPYLEKDETDDRYNDYDEYDEEYDDWDYDY